LNEVFGTEGQVRLLRVLSTETDGTVASSEAAARTGMTESGVRKAFRRLARTGVVERVGEGKSTRYVLRREAGLPEKIAGLFELEGDNSGALIHALRKTLRESPTQPTMAWINHSPDSWGDEVEVGFCCEDGLTRGDLEGIEGRLGRVGREFGADVRVRLFGRAALADVDWAQVVPLVGTPLADGVREPATAESETSQDPPQPQRPTLDLDPRTGAFVSALVALLEDELSLLIRARKHLGQQLENRDPRNGADLWEWRKILDTYPLPRLLHFLQSDSPLAVRMRRSSPFPAILSDTERERMGRLAGEIH
jgi:hypothetical protein